MAVEPETAQAGQRQQGGVAHAVADLVEPGLHVAAQGDDLEVRARVQQLGLAAHRTGADDRARRQGGEALRAVPAMTARPEDQRIAGILALQRAGQHDPRRHLGFEVLQAVHREIDPPIPQGLVNFLGPEPLAADIRQPLARGLGGVPGGGDDVFLEHVHAAQDRAEVLQHRQESAGLHQRERRTAGAHPQRQAGRVPLHVRMRRRGGGGNVVH